MDDILPPTRVLLKYSSPLCETTNNVYSTYLVLQYQYSMLHEKRTLIQGEGLSPQVCIAYYDLQTKEKRDKTCESPVCFTDSTYYIQDIYVI